ncbi:hypothetical protein J3Q64DRAFT_1694373 [Phycomyces blakesleeanus]|uniref:Uncharacterized protein n=1 Tax=Phycomyces blakesleeanus TaxID=4837 RepID=A0ABR3BHD8_PHYBL
MRDRLLNVQTLLPGIITNAVQLTKCDRSNALTYGAPPWAEYGDEWKKFVSQNFDKIAEAGVDLVVKVSAKDYTSATQPNKKPYDGIRTCAVQINTFFRADLPSNVKTFVCTRLQDSMVTSADYTLCFFLALVNMMIS